MFRVVDSSTGALNLFGFRSAVVLILLWMILLVIIVALFVKGLLNQIT